MTMFYKTLAAAAVGTMIATGAARFGAGQGFLARYAHKKT